MQLRLQHNSTPHQPVSAAFIAGDTVHSWLKELSRWNLRPDDMEWYVLPASRQSSAAAGLLVIFKNPVQAEGLDLLEPYTEVASSLFIPRYSILTPNIRTDEWKNLLIWKHQFFHPVLGFIGFEEKDRVEPSRLLSISSPAHTDWSFVNPGLVPQTSLQHIAVIQPSAEELINEMKQDIGENPLENIPKPDDERSWIMKIINWILLGIFALLSFLFISIFKLFSVLIPDSNKSPRYSTPDGIMEKLQRWFNRNMEDLQQKRDREMQRLLKMFDRDQDEALKYAIPLNSPYLNRGEKEGSSARLGKRSINFNLGGLMGGGFAEIWNVDKYRQTLREKYLASAKKEIEQKNFRRAAYIYAHLLGDFYAAANCLEQGGLYREAAALHRDHMKNIQAAATCLERGELYSEAIVLYEEVGNHEKAGDLYTQLENTFQAAQSYEKHVQAKLNTNDFLDAARVLSKKMKDDQRAREALIKGWHSTYQPEPCLRYYFEIVSREGNTLHEIRRVYLEETNSGKRRAFFDVLSHVKKQNKDAEADLFMQDLAYEIVYEQAETGDLSLLEGLNAFVPEDKLLRGDTSRYRSGRQHLPVSRGNPFSLDKAVVWSSAVRHGDQVLVLGERNDFLQLARMNEQGVIDYFSWSVVMPAYCSFKFIHDPLLQNNQLLLQSSQDVLLDKKILPGTRHFRQRISIESPTWLRNNGILLPAMTGEDELVAMNVSGLGAKLDFYNLKGELKQSVPCEGEFGMMTKLICFHHRLYTFFGNIFFEITMDGAVKKIEFDSGIRLFGGTSSKEGSLIIISTNRGCYLLEAKQTGLKLNDEVFFKESIPTQIVALSPMHFALVAGKKVLLVVAANSTLGIISEFVFDTKIVAVVPANGAPYQFVTIEESGKVSISSYE